MTPVIPDPASDTTTKGMNPVPLQAWLDQQAEDIRPAEAVKVSKHRGGRHAKQGERAKRQRKLTIKARIRAHLDAKAMREAVHGPGA